MSFDTDLSATSLSKNPQVMKILVDYQHYHRLLQAEKLQEKNEKKINADLLHKTSKADLALKSKLSQFEASTSQEATKDDSEDSTPLEQKTTLPDDGLKNQSGSGITSNSEQGQDIRFSEAAFKNYIKNELSELVKNLLKDQPLVKLDQTGKGSGDLMPEKNESLLAIDSEPLPGTSINEKSVDKLFTQVDVNRLMAEIPKASSENAHSLLTYFLQNPSAVSWDEDGILTVCNVTIPNSNFYSIFPQLYSNHPKTNLPGFITLCTFIFTSGLQHLIKVKNFTSLLGRGHLKLSPNKMKTLI